VNEVAFSFGTVTVGGKSVQLTARQYDLLKALVDASPEPVPITVLNRIGHPYRNVTYESERAAIRVHIRAIRVALERAEIPLVVEQRRGFGYRCVSS
jgi:DNA-binding response OmpR family regulator